MRAGNSHRRAAHTVTKLDLGAARSAHVEHMLCMTVCDEQARRILVNRMAGLVILNDPKPARARGGKRRGIMEGDGEPMARRFELLRAKGRLLALSPDFLKQSLAVKLFGVLDQLRITYPFQCTESRSR
jgi:hypothetical protein